MKNNIKTYINQIVREALKLKKDTSNSELIVVSDLPTEKERKNETYKNKEKLKTVGFKWNSSKNAWTIPINKFEVAQNTLNNINREKFVGLIEDIEEYVQSADMDSTKKDQLTDKIDQFIEDLANATDEVASSEIFKKYIEFYKKFHTYSFVNSMLIYIQKPDAKRVAGYKQWQEKFNRTVVKGATPISIFAPIIKTNKNAEAEIERIVSNQEDNDSKKTLVGFRIVTVFDISDTEAINKDGEIPELEWQPENKTDEEVEALIHKLEKVILNDGVQVSYKPSERGEGGYTDGTVINVTDSSIGVRKFSTLVHEYAHTLLHFGENSKFGLPKNISASDKEIHAEAIAYIVCRIYDMDVKYHANYIAGWAGSKEKIRQHIEIIHNVSKYILRKMQ